MLQHELFTNDVLYAQAALDMHPVPAELGPNDPICRLGAHLAIMLQRIIQLHTCRAPARQAAGAAFQMVEAALGVFMEFLTLPAVMAAAHHCSTLLLKALSAGALAQQLQQPMCMPAGCACLCAGHCSCEVTDHLTDLRSLDTKPMMIAEAQVFLLLYTLLELNQGGIIPLVGLGFQVTTFPILCQRHKRQTTKLEINEGAFGSA